MFYYFSDGSKFKSKIETIKYANQTGLKPKFYYYDHIYEKIDWTIEPSQSLDYYYKEQAQRIRDNYDYVILAYSGGYDSTNILETFHFNNIKLDKIITVGALSQDIHFGVDTNHNGELYHNVFPYVKELGLESITQVLDYTTSFDKLNNFSISHYNENWVDKMGAWFSPHNWFWLDIQRHIVPPEYKNKKVALIFGKDKPTLFYSPEGKYQATTILNGMKLNGFHFRDTPCMSYSDMGHIEDITRINFYWDPTYPEILIKQLHVMKHVYENLSLVGYDPSTGSQTLGTIDSNKIIYNLKKQLIYKSPKSKDNILSLRDSYLKEKQNSDVYSLYSRGIDRIENEVGLKNIVAIPSRFYDIVK